MFKLNEIKELIKLVDQTSVQELEIENENSRLTIRKPNKTESVIVGSVPAAPVVTTQVQPVAAAPQPNPVSAEFKPAAEKPADNVHTITSPMVGTFYSSSSPGAASFVRIGDKVKEKTVVCIVEAMKLMNEIEAEVKGEIVEILVENGQLVEYGQPLFLVKKD